MLTLLGQIAATAATKAAATAPAAAHAAAEKPFSYADWVPHSYQAYMYATITFAATLLIGALLLYLVRRFVNRFQIRVPLVIAIVGLAVYLGLIRFRPKQFFKPDDPIVPWINRLAAALFLFIGLRLLDRLIVVPLLTRRGKVPLTRFVHQIINILLALFAIVGYLSFAFDWNIDKFLAGSAVVSIVLGLALQETLGNFFSGMVMQASPPFTPGDWIICGAFEGRVVDMTWRAVTLHTDDDNFILIPNATVAKAEIVNFHAPSIATVRKITVGLDYDLPPHEAIDVLSRAAIETKGVQPEPEPEVQLHNFADSAIVYEVKFWIVEPHRHEDIEHSVRMSAWYRLKEKGYTIPFPIRTVEHINLDKKQQRTAAAAALRRARAFGQVPLLAPLSEEQKRHLAQIANDVVLAAGQTLFRQNDAGESFYVIASGSVDVLIHTDGSTERKVATLSTGDFFGEMSALTGQPRTATIRAATPFAGIQIEKQDLLELFRIDPSLMEKISEVVARRHAERDAVAAGPDKTVPPGEVQTQQKSILMRMKRFFRMAG